jgi:hypothetical protein
MRAAVFLATAVAFAGACGGTLQGQAKPDGGNAETADATPESAAPDASVADGSADADAYAADVEAPDVGAGDGNDVADQGVDSSCGLPPSLMPPVFDPPGGSTVELGTSWSITCPMIAQGVQATIFYTTDQAVPTHASMVFTVPQVFRMVGSVTINAICTAECYEDSSFSTATYFVQPPEGGGIGDGHVVISPYASVVNNDFSCTMTTSNPGWNICYTTDGVTTPTCDPATSACTGRSKRYYPSTGAAIDATLADSSGNVTIQAVACYAGATQGRVSPPVRYTFVVADPTMTNPAPGTYTLPADGGGLEPTIGTITQNSSYGTVSIALAEDGGTPSCSDGGPFPSPAIFGGQPGQPSPLTSTATVSAVACKSGYQPSNLVSFPYTIH